MRAMLLARLLVQLNRVVDNHYCPKCGASEAFHPMHPWDCDITPEEWKRLKSAQRTDVAIALRQRGVA